MRFEAAAVLLFCAGDSFAFQLHPNHNGVRLWRRNIVTGRKVLAPIYAGFSDDSPTATSDAPSPPSAASSAFDDMLEKFALPLEFKTAKDNTKAEIAEEKADAKGTSEIKDEKPTASTDNSKAATAESKAQPVEDKKEQVVVKTNDEKVQTVDTEPKAVAKEQKVIKKEAVVESDATIVQNVDDKKEQAAKEAVQKVEDKASQATVVKEAKLVQKIDDKQEEATNEKVLKVVQPADEVKEKASQQQEVSPSSPTTFGPIVTPRRGFSDFGKPDRPEPKIKWDFGEETKMKPTALGVNPNRKTEVVKIEEPEVKELPSPPKKEVEKPTVTEVKETPKSIETPVKTEAVAKDTTKLVEKEEKSSAVKPTPSATEIAPPSPSTDLIQTQPISLPSINLPESLRNVNLEDPGIIASGTVVLGIALSLALVQNMNKPDKPAQKEDGEGEPEPNLIQKVKDAGVAGAISYALWEAGFWGISIPICIVGYNKFTGHWPDFSNSEDMKQLGGEIFAFANVARLAVPLRISLALSTVPWINENIVQKFSKEDEGSEVQQIEVEETATPEEECFVEQVDENEYEETYMSTEWSGDEWQQEEMEYGYDINGEEWQEEMVYEDAGVENTSQWANLEERLSNIEADAMRVASLLRASEDSEDTNTERASLPGSGYLNYIDEYCEPGTRSSNCAGALKGYLDGLATTGAVASEREVTTIVGYLDSLSSNTTPNGESRTGAAFTTYLDALSSGTAPSPPSAKAVEGYLDDLTVDGSVGTRVVDLEGRLNKLESSISSLPDDIASRIISWQDSQDQKMSEELEKIKKMLEDTKS